MDISISGTLSGFGQCVEVKPDDVIRGAAPKSALVLTTRDFKVCEGCGGPSMIHPRLELGPSNDSRTEPRRILCCSCLHRSAKGSDAASRFRIGDQIWECGRCGIDRAWGLFEPADRELVPALECARCKASTRHVYLRVA